MKALLGLVLSVLVWNGAMAASKMYRYENDQGVVVIDYSIPPELVYKGYEVLNASGRVIEKVPRALTREELAAKSEAEREKLDVARQAQADKKLLSIFSGPADAERARDRKIEALDVYINVTRGNIMKLQSDFNQAQAQAAERERAGQAVPEYLVDKMDSLGRQIRQAEESIKEKDGEKDVIRAEYAKDIERLQELAKQRNQRKP